MNILHNNLFNKMNSLKKSFTNSEKKIFEYIEKNPENIIHMNIRDISNEIKIGETTVIRFCKKIGFKGYHDFKISLMIIL